MCYGYQFCACALVRVSNYLSFGLTVSSLTVSSLTVLDLASLSLPAPAPNLLACASLLLDPLVQQRVLYMMTRLMNRSSNLEARD